MIVDCSKMSKSELHEFADSEFKRLGELLAAQHAKALEPFRSEMAAERKSISWWKEATREIFEVTRSFVFLKLEARNSILAGGVYDSEDYEPKFD